MKKFSLTTLACAITLLSACSSMPVKQEIALEPQPVAVPLVLQRVDAEATAPHYRLNPKILPKIIARLASRSHCCRAHAHPIRAMGK